MHNNDVTTLNNNDVTSCEPHSHQKNHICLLVMWCVVGLGIALNSVVITALLFHCSKVSEMLIK